MFKKSVDSIISGLSSMVTQLEDRAADQYFVAADLKVKAEAAEEEAVRADAIAAKLNNLLG